MSESKRPDKIRVTMSNGVAPKLTPSENAFIISGTGPKPLAPKAWPPGKPPGGKLPAD